jgi:hypothetical protein
MSTITLLIWVIFWAWISGCIMKYPLRSTKGVRIDPAEIARERERAYEKYLMNIRVKNACAASDRWLKERNERGAGEKNRPY